MTATTTTTYPDSSDAGTESSDPHVEMNHCPCCGAIALTPDPTLLAVCNVLVVKALETMGKRIARAERSRFRTLGSRPFYEAHMLWQPDEGTVDKALKGAWDVVPALMAVHAGDVSPRQVTSMLDGYVHDLVITGTSHTITELEYRMEDRLGIAVTQEPM